MRIGVMVGPERGRYATKVDRLRADARWAEEAGLLVGLDPADPRRVRRPHRGHPRRRRDQPHRDRHRGRARPAPPPDRPRPAGAVDPGGVRRPPRARPRRVAPLGHRRDARPALRAPGRAPCAPTSTCSTRPSPARARSTSRTTCSGCTTRSTSPTSRPTPVLLAALGPLMLRLAGERTDGTILWLADERAIGAHVAPRITQAAEAAGRPAPRIVAGIPVCLCGDDEVDAAVARTNRILSEAEVSPNYQRLLDHGDAHNVGDILAAGSEATDREAPALLRRRRRHRRLGPGRADRRRPRRAPGVDATAPASYLGVARRRPLTLHRLPHARRHRCPHPPSTSRCSTPTTTSTRPRTR